ncbi:MAG: FAD-dependent monooxygenase [Polyangiaceae bacterium]
MVEVPILIVGAGPTGLTLGCDLARRGVACRVVDKAPRLFVGSRGKGLQPRTLEVFDDLGVLPAVLAAGAPFPPFRLYAGAQLVWERRLEELMPGGMPQPSSRTPHSKPWLIPQSRTDAILCERFLALGGRVDWGTELVNFVQDEAGVTAKLVRDGVEETLRARYLVGADGGRSSVRKHSGVSFAGDTFETERTLIGDVSVSGLDGVACHMFTCAGDPAERFSLWNLPGGDVCQFVATVSAEHAPELSLAAVRRLFEERSGRSDIALQALHWISLYKVNVRMVDRFRIGRVLLAGDAAHVHSSAGGQGLNTSVQDAYNLGWKLSAVVGGASDGLLDTYDEERAPVAARTLGVTSALHQRGFRASDSAAPAIHQLDISYRGSSLALDDRANPGKLRAGDRAPDALLGDGTRLFDAFRGPHFTLLTLQAVDEPLGANVRVCRLEAPLDGYDLGDARWILVRPDGHVGVISGSLPRVREYLDRVS